MIAWAEVHRLEVIHKSDGYNELNWAAFPRHVLRINIGYHT